MVVLDTGSSSTIIDLGFAQHHKLPVISGPIQKNVTYIDRCASYETYEVEVVVVGQDKRFTQKLVAQTVENFSKACYLLDWAAEIEKYDYMQNVRVPKVLTPSRSSFTRCRQLNFFDILEKRKGTDKEPVANKTPLGWAFLGRRVDSDENSSSLEFYHGTGGSTYLTQEDFLDLMVAREFELEHLGLQERESPFSKGFNGGPKDPATWSPFEQKADEKMAYP